MAIVFVLVATLVLAVIVTANWYVWRRLFRDTTRGPGLTRRAGAALIAGGWLLAITALVAERTGVPFWLQQVLAWPGFLWLALSIYLLLAVVAGEFVRPLLRWFLARRARTKAAGPEHGPVVTATGPGTDRGTGVPGGVTASATAAGSPGEGVAGARGGATASATATVPQADGAGMPGGTTASATTAAGERAESDAGVRSGVTASPEAGPRPDVAGVPGGVTASTTAAVPQAERAGAPGAGASGGAVTASATAPHPQDDPAPATPDTTVSTPTGPSRRLFVSRVVAGAAAAAAVGTVGYGTYGVLRGPKVKRVTVPLAKLPRAAHGYRIAVVSDVHLGPVLGRGFAQKVVDTINATQPDLIAVVGDLVDGSVKDLGPAAAPLAQLKARHGSYFVTGNHEYFSGAEQWVEEVRRLGLTPLENARREMPYFDLAGVNDVAGEDEGQGPDYARALGDRDTARACVLLAHQPVQIHDAVEHGVDLQLSGHTHGGQLWPGNLIAAAANPTVAGLERYGDTQLYVSRGAGAWGPPTRVGAPSDITLIELASRQA
ncbi:MULTISPECIES: metallophosphoesterase [Streptomyces]|uniref:Putative metallophosphoesterase n=1 Tax=Streptomyces chartreusis NRRL 3882 TaxID=1079985 RepID=A0A2N9B8A4_STRCX|nr:metallophosphoesterase [Streptomyces chartreusis]MYS92435.1 metallophosphoesterase [Streptomyces sp. SID5464]SOR79568.1 putative metallophosphoesterase [Streptomyces chartreusis NRRL 3882]